VQPLGCETFKTNGWRTHRKALTLGEESLDEKGEPTVPPLVGEEIHPLKGVVARGPTIMVYGNHGVSTLRAEKGIVEPPIPKGGRGRIRHQHTRGGNQKEPTRKGARDDLGVPGSGPSKSLDTQRSTRRGKKDRKGQREPTKTERERDRETKDRGEQHRDKTHTGTPKGRGKDEGTKP